jgi:hypothetical protein
VFGNWIARESSQQIEVSGNGTSSGNGSSTNPSNQTNPTNTSNSSNGTVDNAPKKPLVVEELPLDKLLTVTLEPNQSKYYTLKHETFAGMDLQDNPLVHLHLSNVKGNLV